MREGKLIKPRKEFTMANMTEREFLTSVLAIEGIADELKDYANEGIAKLDARNDKRKNTMTKAQKENEGLKQTIVDTITANGKMVASEIATVLGVSTQKASSLCSLLVKDGTLKVEDVKIPKKGTVKSYSLAE